MSNISRRVFLTRAALTLASAGVTGAAQGGLRLGAAARSPAGPDPELLVVGAGLAGLSAAITAADLGVSVLLIDKRYKHGGTAMGAGGSFSAAGTRIQQAKNITDSPGQHFKDADRTGQGRADPALLRLYTEQAAPTLEWLQQLGVEFDPKGPRLAPEHELYSVPRTYDAVGGGPGYIAALGKQVLARADVGKIQLRMETAATALTARNGRVVGARVVDGDGLATTLSAKAVLLACGGYGSNREMLKRYNPSLARALTVASKYSTGDGLRMAEAIGARLVNMDLLVPYFAGVENPPGSNRTMMISLISGILSAFKGDVWVNKAGARFVNEDTASPDERERALRRVADAAVFAVFDDRILKANKPPIFNWDGLVQEGRVVKTAGSIGELALKLDIPARQLASTIERYNGHAEAGRDADFGRRDLVPIQVAPFYAIAASGVVFMTFGGIRTSSELEAMDHRGRVIPGLYAAGEVQGAAQWMGDGLMGGAGNGAALVFGRLAAMAAAKALRA